MMSICEHHDDLLAVRVNGVNDRTLDGAVLLASRLLRLRLQNWKNIQSHKSHEKFSVSHLGSWAGSLLHTKPCSVNSTLKRSLESKQLRAQKISDRINLDCHLFFLSRLKPGNGLLFFCIFLSLLGLHLLHHLLKLLLGRVIRTQQLSLLLKLENLEAFFFEDDFKFRDPLLRKLVDDPLCRSFA